MPVHSLKYLLTTLFLWLFFYGIKGQTTGFVYDVNTEQPLIGAYILTNKTSTSTDSSGYFNIQLRKHDSLIISFIGYQSKKIKVEDNDLIVFLEPKNIQIENVYVTAWDISGNKYAATSNLQILDKKNGLQKNNTSIVEDLKNQPGIMVHEGNFGTNRIVIRGIGSRTQYATNGIKAYYNNIPISSIEGITNLENVPTSFIDHVEIIKGPASSVYGAGMGGVLLMKGRTMGNAPISFDFQNNFGSFNTLNNALNLHLNKNKFQMGMGLANASSDGYRNNSAYNRQNIIVTPTYFSKRVKASFLVLYSNVKAFIPSSLNTDDYNNNPEVAAFTWNKAKGYEDYNYLLAGSNTVIKLSPRLYINATAFFQTSNNYEQRPVPLHTLNGSSHNFGTRSFISFQKNKFLVNLGGEFMQEDGQWELLETIENNTGGILNKYIEHKNYLNLFGLALWSRNNFKLSLSANLNSMLYQMKDDLTEDTIFFGNTLRFPFTLSPRLGMNISLNPKSHLFASVSSGFMPPSFAESINPEGLFNETLKPETGLMTEIGARNKFLNNKWYNELTIYNLISKNMIVTKRLSEAVFYDINAGKVNRFGLEGYNRIQLIEKNNKTLLLHSNFEIAFSRFLEFIDNNTDYSGKSLPGLPNGKINTSFDAQIYQWLFRINHLGVNSQYLNDSNTEKIKGYQLFSLMSAYNLSAKKFNIEISAEINNLFNQHYASMVLINAPLFGSSLPRYYYPGLPRTYSISLNISID